MAAWIEAFFLSRGRDRGQKCVSKVRGERRKGVNWGVQFGNVLTLTFLWLFMLNGMLSVVGGGGGGGGGGERGGGGGWGGGGGGGGGGVP